ncbi:hypothetical protein V6N13_046557 [Hibiscus sabdariffa]|uniref:Uncharacterized protein n=1 Tax=Hibiscus sabdariffa TaxID=183260 RepID=A0ABR2NZA1_9ROSI
MCQFTSSCKCDSDVPIEDSEGFSNIYEPFIQNSPTSKQEPKCYSMIQTEKTDRAISVPLAIKEAIAIANIAVPMILTGLMLYSRSLISMLFLGRLGELPLAGGSLAIGFANITGYSILSGLAMGMESICGQAFGAKRYAVLGITLQRTVLLLLVSSLPISVLWTNMRKILILCGQDEIIAMEAQWYLFYSVPDLLAQSLLHPLRIYLRTQSITLPLTCCAILSILLHIPINYLLVSCLKLGIKGVALGGVWTNFNLVASLVIYILYFGVHKKTWGGLLVECFKEWKSLLNLAVPSCISVCLEWWWYEIMSYRCFDGDFDSNDRVDLHIPIVSKLRCVDESRKRARCKPAQ